MIYLGESSDLADIDNPGTLLFWEGVEFNLRVERQPELPVLAEEWHVMRVNAAKSWLEANPWEAMKRGRPPKVRAPSF